MLDLAIDSKLWSCDLLGTTPNVGGSKQMAELSRFTEPSATAFVRVGVIIAALLQIVVPVLPSLGFGTDIGDRSDDVRTLITPAGWAFSIWGPLYTGSIAYAVYQALPRFANVPLLFQTRWPAAGAFLGNALWAAYVQSFGLSVISAAIILFTLACLLVIYRRVADQPEGFSRSEQWLVVLPLSALASWLTAAAIVNIAAALRYHGVDGGETTPLIAAAVILVGGLIAGAALLNGRGNPPYALVFLWALAAIYAAGGQQAAIVAGAVVVAALLVVAATVVALRRVGLRYWFKTRSSPGRP